MELPANPWLKSVAWNSLARRAVRFQVYNILPRSPDSLFITFGKDIYVTAGSDIVAVRGLSRRFRVLSGCAALDRKGDIYFGEYFGNKDRASPVRIYRLPSGSDQAEVAHEFASGEVRHVHGVHLDPFTDDLVVLTGDFPSECRISRSRNGFAEMESIGAGDESWRALFPIFTSRSVYYATDAEFDDNAIYRIDRESGQRTLVTGIDGPSYYAGQVSGIPVFATTAELCPSQREPFAAIWVVGDDRPAAMLSRFRKDLFCVRRLVPLFQPGIIHFARTEAESDTLPFTGSGLRGLNGRMFAIHRTGGRG